MSYDIRFAVKVAGAKDDCYAVIGHPEHDSPTYNNRKIFEKCMDWDYDQGVWYPVTDVLPKVERGIQELTHNAEAYRDLEPENGWGGIASSLISLRSIVKWLKDDMAWGWNNDIPLECIYMCW